MDSAAPTIVAVETNSAWVVILAVSLVLLPATLLLRRVVSRPGGLGSAALMMLPLMLPLVAAMLYQGGVLPEISVLRPLSDAVMDRPSHGLRHVLMLSDGRPGVGIPYVLNGSAGLILLLVGLLASSVMLLRRALGVMALRRLLARCEAFPPDDRVVALVRRLAAAADIEIPQTLLLPEGASGAFATGGRRKRILISSDLIDELEPAELEAIVAHEIAHIKARDIPIVFFAGFLRDLVAWNPFAHVAYRRLVLDRECEADQRAAAATGQPLMVASSLLKVCNVMQRNRGLNTKIALAFFRPRSRLKRRVNNLLALADGTRSFAPVGLTPFLLAGCLACVLGLQVAARLATQAEAGGLAIVVGAPDQADVWRAEPPPKFLKKDEPRKLKDWAPDVRAWPADLAVRQRDFPKFLSALNAWSKRHEGPLHPFIEASTRNWRAMPLIEGVGLSIYRIDPLGRLASVGGGTQKR